MSIPPVFEVHGLLVAVQSSPVISIVNWSGDGVSVVGDSLSVHCK